MPTSEQSEFYAGAAASQDPLYAQYVKVQNGFSRSYELPNGLGKIAVSTDSATTEEPKHG